MTHVQNPWATVRRETVEHQVSHRLDALRRLDFVELAALPAWRSEEVAFGSRVGVVTTYREPGPGGALEIVVQCMPEGRETGTVWRGVVADGFRAWPDGRREALPERDKDYFR